ncbi:MAG: tRNA (cytidine(34)-2'-O)-methyltransferase [Myxococcota bacterium]
MSEVFHIVLYQPEIPPNTGNVGRLCVGVGASLHLVPPLGFSTDEKAVRRAGLDYWRHVALTEHASTAAFWDWAYGRRVHLFSAKATASVYDGRFEAGDVFVFGCETKGLPADVLSRGEAYRLPMKPGPIRSLNLGNAVSIVTYEALRQIGPAWFA